MIEQYIDISISDIKEKYLVSQQREHLTENEANYFANVAQTLKKSYKSDKEKFLGAVVHRACVNYVQEDLSNE